MMHKHTICNNIIFSITFHQDVWLKDKGIHFEGEPPKVPDSVRELSDQCFGQFGILNSIPFTFRNHYQYP